MKTSTKFFLSVILLFSACTAFADDDETHEGHEVKGRQVVFRLSNSSSAVLQRLSQLGDADDFRALNRKLNLFVLHSKSANVAALLATLKNEAAITYVEPDYIVKAVGTTPNDVDFSQQ